MHTTIKTILVATAILALGSTPLAAAQVGQGAAALGAAAQNFTPIAPAACQGWGRWCPPGYVRACGPYRCWCRPCR